MSNTIRRIVLISTAFPQSAPSGYSEAASIVAQSPARRAPPPCNVGVETGEATAVTLRQVLQAPADFDGHWVRLEGFVVLPFEGTAVYETPADFNHRRRWRSIFLTLNPDLKAQGARPACDGVDAVVEGKFNGFENGTFGLFPATLDPVTRISGTTLR